MTAIKAAQGSFGSAQRFAQQDLGALYDLIGRLLRENDTDLSKRAVLSQMIGPRADRERLQAVMELAQTIAADMARNSENLPHRSALIEVHGQLVQLAGQAPNYNFDTSLLTLEIGTLLMRAGQASERAHG